MKKIIGIFIVVMVFTNMCFVRAVNNSAASAIVMNARTRTVIYEKNANTKRAMASTTKIMTALLLAECNTPQKKVTVTAPMVAVEGSSMGLRAGDTVTYNDLLYGILLPSGNDAANTAAISICGSIEKFAQLMNKRAKELGLKNTHFVTPSGLDADSHYTTAYDLALLTSFALENNDFLSVASSKSVVLEFGGEKRYLANHNRLLKTYDGAIGVKTGYTSKAGRCLVSAAQKNDSEIIVVTLNDRNDWEDHARLLDYGFQNCNVLSAMPTIPATVSCVGADASEINLVTSKIDIGLSGADNLEYKTYLPRFVYAPISRGDIVGYTDAFSNGYKVATIPIYADSAAQSENQHSILFNKIFKRFIILIRGL